MKDKLKLKYSYYLWIISLGVLKNMQKWKDIIVVLKMLMVLSELNKAY